jgi:hypothetical protein
MRVTKFVVSHCVLSSCFCHRGTQESPAQRVANTESLLLFLLAGSTCLVSPDCQCWADTTFSGVPYHSRAEFMRFTLQTSRALWTLAERNTLNVDGASLTRASFDASDARSIIYRYHSQIGSLPKSWPQIGVPGSCCGPFLID